MPIHHYVTAPQAKLAPTEKPVACIARQPILTVDESVVGYELFFRGSRQERHFESDGEIATLAVVDTLSLVGLEVLCDGTQAFINCSYQSLLTEQFSLLPPRDVVIEVERSLAPDAEILQACENLKKGGYAIALDNFEPDDPRHQLLPYASFLKVDVSRVSPAHCLPLVQRYASPQCQLLAQKVETREAFTIAVKNGFTRFQGYFFRRPENMQLRQIPANQATNLRLLSAVSKPEVDFGEIETLIKRDPALCYRLLRYLNSPALALSAPVVSIRSALTLLGEREAVKWIRMATAQAMSQNRPSDILLSSLTRARFCELIAPKLPKCTTDLFLMGMLSLIDAILSLPMGLILEELAIDSSIKAQLLSAKAGGKTPLSPIYDLMVAREEGDWEQVTAIGRELNLSLASVAEASNAAMRWAHGITNEAPSAPQK